MDDISEAGIEDKRENKAFNLLPRHVMTTHLAKPR